MSTLDPAPPGSPLTRAGRMRGPVAALGALALLTAALRVHDPHQRFSWGACPSALLGIACPGCGGLRAVNDLTHGDVVAAASSNLALVVALPFLVALLATWTLDRWRGTRTRLPARAAWWVTRGSLVALGVFTLLRNLPGSWLAP